MSKLFALLKPYHKAIVALLTAAVIGAWPAWELLFGDGKVDAGDIRAAGIALFGAIVVYLKKNYLPQVPAPYKPPATWTDSSEL